MFVLLSSLDKVDQEQSRQEMGAQLSGVTEQRPSVRPVIKRIPRALALAAPSMLLSTATNVSAFAIGATTGIPGVDGKRAFLPKTQRIAPMTRSSLMFFS